MARSAKLVITFFYTDLLSLSARVSPTRVKFGSITCSGTHTLTSLSFIFGFFKTKSFNNILLISTPTHLPTHVPQSNYPQVWGFGLCQPGYLILSERATNEVKKSKFGARAIFLLFRLPSYRLGSEPEARDNNVPVSRYRTPFEYADITPLMNDKKCTGWTPASPLVQLVFIRLYCEICESRDSIYTDRRSTFPECPGFPNAR
jgi:hypothetical protein